MAFVFIKYKISLPRYLVLKKGLCKIEKPIELISVAEIVNEKLNFELMNRSTTAYIFYREKLVSWNLECT